MGNGRVIGDELSVEVSKTKEGVYVFDFDRGQPGGNAIKFDQVHGELTRFHNHSEVFDFGNVELAFLKLQVKIELGHVLENMMGSFGMGLGVWRGNEEGIHIDDEPSFGNHVSE